MKYLIVLALIISCGKPKPEDNRQFKTVNPEFLELIDVYEQLKGSSIKSMGIGFKSLSYPVVGVCLQYSDGKKEIHIDETYWRQSSNIRKIALLFHELGHCDLGREHTDTIVDGRPTSIMNRYVIEWYSQEEEDYYFEELFGN